MSEALLNLSEVMDRTTLGRSEIYRRMEADTFPKSIPIGKQRVAWLESEVSAWIAEQVRAARSTTTSAQEGDAP